MASATVAIITSDYELGVSALQTDIQTWLTANATGVIKAVFIIADFYIAVLEVPPTA